MLCAPQPPPDPGERKTKAVRGPPESVERPGIRHRLTFPCLHQTAAALSPPIHPQGFVTLPCREREVSVPQELSGRCDCSPPRGHRDTAKHAVRLG